MDAPASTGDPGLVVKRSPSCAFEEMRIGKFIAVADPFEPEWRRPVVAHGVGHGFARPGNQLWRRRHTDLGHGFERAAKDFSFGLLVDSRGLSISYGNCAARRTATLRRGGSNPCPSVAGTAVCATCWTAAGRCVATRQAGIAPRSSPTTLSTRPRTHAPICPFQVPEGSRFAATVTPTEAGRVRRGSRSHPLLGPPAARPHVVSSEAHLHGRRGRLPVADVYRE